MAIRTAKMTVNAHNRTSSICYTVRDLLWWQAFQSNAEKNTDKLRIKHKPLVSFTGISARTEDTQKTTNSLASTPSYSQCIEYYLWYLPMRLASYDIKQTWLQWPYGTKWRETSPEARQKATRWPLPPASQIDLNSRARLNRCLCLWLNSRPLSLTSSSPYLPCPYSSH